MPVHFDQRKRLLAELDQVIAMGEWPHPIEEATKSRGSYLEFIKRFGFTLADVEGPHTGQSEAQCLDYAQNLLKYLRDNPNGPYSASMAWAAHSAITGESTDNFLLDHDVRRLRETGAILQSPLPDFEIGIFPMYSSSAQVTKFHNKHIILLDTGLLRLLRYFCTVLLGNIAPREQAPLIWKCVDDYIKNRTLLPIDYEAVRLASDGDKWGLFIVNEYQAACRQFLIAHEVAHILFGHEQPYGDVNIGLSDGLQLNAIEKTELSEFEADASAATLQLASAFYLHVEDISSRRRGILMAVAGPATVFAMALLFEFSRRHHGIPTEKGHPYTSLRIHLLFRIVEFYGQHEHCWLARRATELAHVCCEQYYPAEVASFRCERISEANFRIIENILANIARAPLPVPTFAAK